MQSGDETLYSCDGVLYRSTYYQDDKVYEIVSDAPEEVAAEPTTVIGMELTDPMTRGQLVRDLQNRLVAVGYDVGGVDGVFGSGTLAAVEWFQYDNEFEVTGMVDATTARALGFETGAPEDAAPAPSGTEANQTDAVNE